MVEGPGPSGCSLTPGGTVRGSEPHLKGPGRQARCCSPALKLPAHPRTILHRVLLLFLQPVPLAPQVLLGSLQLLPLLPQLLGLLLGHLQAVSQVALLPSGQGEGSRGDAGAAPLAMSYILPSSKAPASRKPSLTTLPMADSFHSHPPTEEPGFPSPQPVHLEAQWSEWRHWRDLQAPHQVEEATLGSWDTRAIVPPALLGHVTRKCPL